MGVTVGADADVGVAEDVLVKLEGVRDVLDEVSVLSLSARDVKLTRWRW